MFNPSLLKLIDYQPWRYTTQPNPDGTGGVKETMTGVLVMADDVLIAELRALLTTTLQRTTFDTWIYRVTEAQAAEWHIPMWAGDTSAAFIRVPAAIWSRWDAAVPAVVKARFAHLYREASAL